MSEQAPVAIDALIEANRDRITVSVEAGRVAIAVGEPMVSLDEAIAKTNAADAASSEADQ